MDIIEDKINVLEEKAREASDRSLLLAKNDHSKAENLISMIELFTAGHTEIDGVDHKLELKPTEKIARLTFLNSFLSSNNYEQPEPKLNLETMVSEIEHWEGVDGNSVPQGKFKSKIMEDETIVPNLYKVVAKDMEAFDYANSIRDEYGQRRMVSREPSKN